MSFRDDLRGREASNLAFQAERLRSAGDEAGARKHYARAAALEAEVLATLAPADSLLYSTLAVSAAALWFKAKEARSLDELATRLLAGDRLAPGARAEISEMRDELLTEERERVRRQVVTTTFLLADNFRQLIELAVRQSDSLASAARGLGISRHALRRMIKKYKIVVEADEPTSAPVGGRTGASRDAG